jgi:deazaflavin-dependent oxidoreductase (nitroreductase family)
MQAPRIMRRINRAFTNPLVRTVAGALPPLAIVHHVGRKSGRRYRTPVLAFPTEEGYVTPLPYGTDTDWCLNVVDAGRCTLEARGRKVRVGNPRVVGTDAGVPLLPALMQPALRLAALPGYLLLDRERARRPARGRPRQGRRPSR